LANAVVRKIAGADILQSTGVLDHLTDLVSSTAWVALTDAPEASTNDAAAKALSVLARNFAKVAKANNTSITNLATILCPLPTTLDSSRPQRVYHQDLSVVLVTLSVLASALQQGVVPAADIHATMTWITTTTHHLQLLIASKLP
jgi:hypothetical protein